jgi:hypothetical protein
MDIGGGDHRCIVLGSWYVGDAFENPPPPLVEESAVAIPRLAAVAFSRSPGDSSTHSKASGSWNNEDVFLPQLFQILQGLSSFFSDFNRVSLYITLG